MAPNSNFYIFIILLENQKVFHSFASRAQPSSDKLTGDVTGVVRLAGRLLSMEGTYTATPVPSCFNGQDEFWITHMDMQTRERNRYECSEK